RTGSWPRPRQGVGKAALTDAAVVGRILREYHQARIEPSSIRRLTGSVRGARVSYWLGEPRGPARPGLPRGPGGPAVLGRPGEAGGAGLGGPAFPATIPLAG